MSSTRPTSGGARPTSGGGAPPTSGGATRPTSSATRRVIGVAPAPSREPSPLDGGLPWASGLLAAAQAAVLSLAVIVVPAVAVFVATSADPANAGVLWTRAVEIGAGLWLLGHGVPLGDVTLVPLGVTALAGYACYASARRSLRPAPWALATAVAAYVVLVVAVALLVPSAAAQGPRAGLGGLLVGGLGLGLGALRRDDAEPLLRLLRGPWRLLPGWLRAGAAAGVAGAAALAVLAAMTAAGWVLAGRGTIVEVVRGLEPGLGGGAVLAVTELGYVPNLAAWALAWLAGPGFAVGAGTHWATSGVVDGPLPAVPLLGALPTDAMTGGTARLSPVLLVVAGLLAGGVVHRRLRAARAWEPAAAGLAAGVVCGLLVAAGVGAASGAAGTGLLAQIGASAWPVAGLAAAGVAIGAALAALVGDPLVRTGVRGALRPRTGVTAPGA